MGSWIKRIALFCALALGASAGATVFAGCGDDDDGTVVIDGSTTVDAALDARARD